LLDSEALTAEKWSACRQTSADEFLSKWQFDFVDVGADVDADNSDTAVASSSSRFSIALILKVSHALCGSD
jgi:hypothetical protein